MKKVGLLSVLFYFLFSFLAYAFTFDPVSNFTDWTEYQSNSVNFEIWGNSVTMNISGSEGIANGSFYKEFQNSIGMMVTVNVSAMSGTANAGIAKFEIGQTQSGNRIQALIGLGTDGEKKKIFYNIHERDSETNEYIRTILDGVLGGYSESIIGNSVTIALARVGNEIWFHASGNGILKYALSDMASGTPNGRCSLWGDAQSGTSNSINASYSNLSIIYE